MSQKKKNWHKDRFFRLKYIGFCLSQTPPDLNDFEYEDLIDHAKWTLCSKFKYLPKDPIWDDYSDVEILAHYYATLFDNDPDFLKEFKELYIDEELEEKPAYDEVADWMDEMIEANKKEVAKIEEELRNSMDEEDAIEFSPEGM